MAVQELAHGLGVLDSTDAYVDMYESEGGFFGPIIYDTLLVSSSGARLLDMMDPSAELGRQLTGGAVYLDGPATTAAMGTRPQVFAPSHFLYGSSISHLDESVYPDGDENALMTPLLARREAIHTPGPILMGIMSDIGWGAPAGTPQATTPTPTRSVRPTTTSTLPTRTATATRTATPWPTPKAPGPVPTVATTPAPPGTAGLEIRHATWMVDPEGLVWAIGEVFNGSKSTVGEVVVEAQYLSASGKVIGEDYGFTQLDAIPPGGDAPFVVLADPARGVARMSINLAIAFPPEEAPVTGIDVNVASQTLSPLAVLHVAGTVTNTSTTAWKNLVLYMAVYNDKGEMVGIQVGFTRPSSIDPGRTAVFDIAATDLGPDAATLTHKIWVDASR